MSFLMTVGRIVCTRQFLHATAQYFFFSSRRRHTRWTGDWSSDVCSPICFLYLVFGREAVFGHRPAAQVAHLRLHETPQITRRAVGHAEHGMELVVELDHHSWAQLCCGKHSC